MSVCPSRVAGTRVMRTPLCSAALSEAGWSMLDTSKCPQPAATAAFTAMLIASVPEPVNTMSCAHCPMAMPTASRASAMILPAARPCPCCADALPTLRMASATASMTAEGAGLVALWSR